jgi:hypothetical protein
VESTERNYITSLSLSLFLPVDNITLTSKRASIGFSLEELLKGTQANVEE